jgi:hypothetical protein
MVQGTSPVRKEGSQPEAIAAVAMIVVLAAGGALAARLRRHLRSDLP